MRVRVVAVAVAVAVAWLAVTSCADAATVSGTVTLPSGEPAVGFQVAVNGLSPETATVTDASGAWRVAVPAPGSYQVAVTAFVAGGSVALLTVTTVAVGTDDPPPLATALTSAPNRVVPAGLVAGAAAFPSGIVLPGVEVLIGATDGSGVNLFAWLDSAGRYSAVVPAGAYTVTPETSDGDFDLVGGAATPVTVVATQTARADVTLGTLAVSPGATAANAQRDLGYLNAERARWGLPAGLVEDPLWSQACGSHDAYLKRNNVLQHPETAGKPGYSDGGNWAGTHAVLSGGGWTAAANPWEDAPIHLNQLFSPDLELIGIDESSGACATTWPGMLSLRATAGTVFTYPGDGMTGLPPAEDAEELPFVPGSAVGLPAGTVAGRELFVYEEADPTHPQADIASASLVGPTGAPVDIRWVDSNTPQVGPYLAGAIIIPVAPLAPFTRYTATVSLSPLGDLPPVTHQWSFTTGAANLDPSSDSRGHTARGHAPAITHLRVSPRRVRTHHKAAFRFRLSAAASVRLVVSHAATGRRSGRHCVRATTRLRHAARCTRRATDATLSLRAARAGERRVAFSRRLKRLRPGRYRVTATARDAGGTSRAATAAFTVSRS